MNVGFLSNQIGLRGTEVAMFDYAHYNEVLLGNKSHIVSFGREINESAFNKFKDRFGKVSFIEDSKTSLDNFVEKNKIDVLYKICFGLPENVPSSKTVVHVVFNVFTPFGDVYSYVSEQIRDRSVPPEKRHEYDFVPHIVSLPDVNDNLRKKLGFKDSDFIFGYHGGKDSFDIDFVKKTIVNFVQRDVDVKFLFMNVDRFYSNTDKVVHINGTSCLVKKTKFINTCDAMIHARSVGETFGLSCGEFSLRGKPVVTYGGSPDNHHLDVLGDKAIIYRNEQELKQIFNNIRDIVDTSVDYNCYRKFSPELVMSKFDKVFLK